MNEDVISSIAKTVLDLGYRSQIDDGRVLTSVGGTKAVIHWTDPGSLQFSAGIRAVPDGFGLEQLNDYNRRYRFGSLYMNPDGSMVLQADFLFDPDEPDQQSWIEKMLSLFEACAGQMRQALFEATEKTDSSDQDDREATPVHPNTE